MGRRTRWLGCVAVCGVWGAIAQAQLVTEEIPLRSGWNAVWFNVEPETSDVLDFLASQASPLDCQAIWTFEPNRDVTADPSSTSPGRWLFFDRDIPPSLLTLRTLQGHRAYLIEVNVGGPLRVAGRPVIRSLSFSGRVSNLFGAMSIALGGVLTFEEFFAHPNAAGKIVAAGAPVKHDIFSITDGELVRRTLIDPITPNEAYWVNVVQDLDYPGPLDVTSSANGISFGRSTALRTLSIDVPSSPTTRTLTLRAHPCVELNGGACTATAGGVEWLEYREPSTAALPVWRPLVGGFEITASAGTTKVNLDLRARRTTLSALTGVTSGLATLPPLVIDVSDDQGSRVVIPSDVEVEPIFGLWAGKAVLTRVSAHPSIQDIPLEQAEATPLEMALILDLPSPAQTAGGAAPRLLDTVTVQTFRDGRSLQRRFSSVLFDRPVNLAEDAGDPLDPLGTTGTMRGTLQILPDDPLNPYRHRYNPEHRRGYEIRREITITLDPGEPSLTEQLAGLDGTFGPQRLNGVYGEVITGLSERPITVRGRFRLERIGAAPVSP